ncbi:MAG: CRTAC1 family protein, partial [Bryobacteraceae bacterium]
SSGCTFLDYDRDGRLDLFVTSYQQFDLATTPPPGKTSNCEWKGMPVFCGPRGLPFGRATLFHQRPDGTFEDVTDSSGIAAAQGFYAFTPVAADLNGDGWVDIYFASDSTPSMLFRNEKNGRFREIGTESGVALNEHGFEQGGMGVAVGDYNRDGRLDLVKTNFAGDHPNLYRNTGGGIFEDAVFAAGLGVNPQYVGWGVALADLDNDGWQDILQVNGHVYPELDRAGRGESYRQARLVYRNLGNGRFEDVSSLAGPGIVAKHSSRGMAVADFDNDGDLDAAVMNMGETPSYLRNRLPANTRWIKVNLEGVQSNRSAIGAVVAIEAGGARQTLPVLGQSSFLSQNERRLHFGLGDAAKADSVHVLWPSGRAETFDGGRSGSTLQL